MNVNPYLFFDGQCEEAFRFYATCTGGEIEVLMPHTGSPAEDSVPPEWGPKIMYAQLRIGESRLMASDAPPGRQSPMSGFAVSLQVEQPQAAEHCFAALSEGGTVIMPLEETFWALRFAMFTDRYGVKWMVNCPRPQ